MGDIMKQITELTYNEIIFVSGGDDQTSHTVIHMDVIEHSPNKKAIPRIMTGCVIGAAFTLLPVIGLISLGVLFPIGAGADRNPMLEDGLISVHAGIVATGAVIGGLFGLCGNCNYKILTVSSASIRLNFS